jgi:hypothetical protein
LRAALLLLIGLAAIAAPAPVKAASLVAPRLEAGPSPDIIEVARNCGHDHHWVPRHHTHDGRLIHGHCALNHRH